jgi:hypothetical protein
MLVIYKLFIIGGLNKWLIEDLVPYIKKVWLMLETVVIEPPSIEEWNRDKVFDPNPIRTKTDRYMLVKNDIMYIEYKGNMYNVGTYEYLQWKLDPIIYVLNNKLSLSVNFHKTLIDPKKLYYKQFNNFTSGIVLFYHFHCNT